MTQSVDYNADKVLPPQTITNTEQSLTLDPGLRTRVLVQLIGTSAFYLRSAASGDNMPVPANTPYNVSAYGHVGAITIYWVRQSSDGTLNMSVVE